MTIRLAAPLDGWSGPLDEAPDRAFAEGMLGEGVAIDPIGETLYAPCAGLITALAAARHAVSLRTEEGLEVLMHIGLETVALEGDGFTPYVSVGETVSAGQRLIGFDLDRIALRARSLLTPILVANADAFECVWRRQDREVEVGEPLLEVRARTSQARTSPREGLDRRRTVTVGWVDGVHARPAARLSQVARTFVAELSLEVGPGAADLRSPVAVMALGLRAGDTAVLRARGPDASVALGVVGDLLNAKSAEDPPGKGGGTAGLSGRGAKVGAPAPQSAGSLLHGVPAAPGLAVGVTARLRRETLLADTAAGAPDAESRRLQGALEQVRADLSAAAREGGLAAEILTAHLSFLEDPSLIQAAEASVRSGRPAGAAWSSAARAQAAVLRRAADPRVRERSADLDDLDRRVLEALSGMRPTRSSLPRNAILLSDDVLPSELLALKGAIVGVCTAAGGPTAHVSLIAASLNLPMLVAVGGALNDVPEGAAVVLDASAGVLEVDPAPEALARAAERAWPVKVGVADLPTVTAPGATRDGAPIAVLANLADVAEASLAVASGCEGCGLLRTEFLFQDRLSAPGEAEQHAAYQAIAHHLGGRPLVIRTLDIGGDKPAAFLEQAPEANPALGMRGVRISLGRPDLLREQLRAILGVRPLSSIRIMLPMIVSASEVLAVRAILLQEARALQVTPPPLGVMIETPAAALTTAELAAEADFFSVGSNDLTQYALAMDRGNPALASKADALHPAVLRLIALACEGAAVRGRPVGVCGAMASDPATALLLVGLGASSLSVATGAGAVVKAMLGRVSLADCRALAVRALKAGSAREVRSLLAEAAAPAEPPERTP